MKLNPKEMIMKCGVKRRKHHLYFVDKDGDVSEVRMKRGGEKRKRKPPKKVYNSGIKKESGYLYYLDSDGNIGRVKSMTGSLFGDEMQKLRDRKKKILRAATLRNKKEKKYID